jgi:exonuclease III
MPTKKNARCPKEAPLLCSNKSLAKGLCVKTRKDCKSRTLENRPIPITRDNGGRGKEYGYAEADLGRGCYTTEPRLDYDKSYENYDDIPDNFKLMTYNIWGLAKPKLQRLFKLRKDLLIKTISAANADMMCLQEMSEFAYEEIKEYITAQKFASEVPFKDTTQSRERSVEVYYVSKYKPKRVSIYGVPGVLNYKNTFMVVEYNNLVIFNLYSQAGSSHSPGQEEKGIHYARCRYDIMNIIYDMIKAKYKGFSVVFCGDLNFHIDGDKEEWPEAAMLDKFYRSGFIDTYRDLNKDLGLTENTDTNLMRYNQKLIVKKFRFDAVLYKPMRRWQCKKAIVFGKELEYLNAEDSEWFYKTISDAQANGISIDKLRGAKKHGSKYLLPINPSDHFGILTTFRR